MGKYYKEINNQALKIKESVLALSPKKEDLKPHQLRELLLIDESLNKILTANEMRDRQIQEGSIEKFIQWSGVLCEIFSMLRQLKTARQQLDKMSVKRFNEINLKNAEALGDLLVAHDSLLNDFGFLKDI